MKHDIIVKWNPDVDAGRKAEMIPAIRELFECAAANIPGIHSVELFTNVTPRPNRYDLMIEIDMDPEALDAYDDCEWHHRWKSEYGSLIEKKAIFDHD